MAKCRTWGCNQHALYHTTGGESICESCKKDFLNCSYCGKVDTSRSVNSPYMSCSDCEDEIDD